MISLSWEIVSQYKRLINQILLGKKSEMDLTKRVELTLKKLDLTEHSKQKVLKGITEILAELKNVLNSDESQVQVAKKLFRAWQKLEKIFKFEP